MTEQDLATQQAMKQLWAMLATAYPHSFISALGQYGGNASKLWQAELQIYGADAISRAAYKAIRMRDPKTGEAMQFPPTLPVVIGLTEECWAELQQLPTQQQALQQLIKLLRHRVENWPSDFLYNLYTRINQRFSAYNWLRLPAEKQQRLFPSIYSGLLTDLINGNDIKKRPSGLLTEGNIDKESPLTKEQLTEHAVSSRPDFAQLRKKISIN